MWFCIEPLFSHRIKNKKDNCDFVRHIFFLTIASLHLVIATFYLRIVLYQVTILC